MVAMFEPMLPHDAKKMVRLKVLALRDGQSQYVKAMIRNDKIERAEPVRSMISMTLMFSIVKP
jgi:hypothetical protein